MRRATHVTLEQARAAKAAVRKRFQKLGIAAAVGITRVDNEYAVKVNVNERPTRSLKLPATIDGVAIRLEVTGAVRSQT